AMTCALPTAARADAFELVISPLDRIATLPPQEIAGIALMLGALLFGVTAAILMIRTRVRASAANASKSDDIIALRAERDRVNTMLMSEPQIVVTWVPGTGEPTILGDTTLVTSSEVPLRVLAFGSWLDPDKAQALQHAVDGLRENGESFTMGLMTIAGRTIDAEGRAIGGCAVLRLRDVSGFKRELAELNTRYEKLAGNIEALRTLIEALPAPVWVRDSTGALVIANAAYARAVEAKDQA